MSDLAITADDVERAARTIADDVVETPSTISQTLSEIAGATVVVKFENQQFTGSFKDRGAANRLHGLTADERKRGVVAASAGNHAQGVAHHAGRLGIPATIVMPTSAPFTKVVHTEGHGATVVQHGQTIAEAGARAAELAASSDLVLVHPYDDPAVMAGQGTLAVELLRDHDDLDAIVAPVGAVGSSRGSPRS